MRCPSLQETRMYRRCDFTARGVSYCTLPYVVVAGGSLCQLGWATWQRREKCVKRQTMFVVVFSRLRSKLQQESASGRGQEDDTDWYFVVTISSLALSTSFSLFCRWRAEFCEIGSYDPVHLTPAGTNSLRVGMRDHTHPHGHILTHTPL